MWSDTGLLSKVKLHARRHERRNERNVEWNKRLGLFLWSTTLQLSHIIDLNCDLFESLRAQRSLLQKQTDQTVSTAI